MKKHYSGVLTLSALFGALSGITLTGCNRQPRQDAAVNPQGTPRPQGTPKSRYMLRFAQMDERTNLYAIFQDGERLTMRGQEIDALQFRDSAAKATVYVPLRATGERGGITVGYNKNSSEVFYDYRVLDVPLVIVDERAYTDETSFRSATGWQFKATDLSGHVGMATVDTVLAKSQVAGPR